MTDHSKTLIDDLNSAIGLEDLGFDEKERFDNKKLKEIEKDYLIDADDDDELFLYRGIGKNKTKQKANETTFMPLKSPYIPIANESGASQS